MPRDVHIDQNVHRSLPSSALRPTSARCPVSQGLVTGSPCRQCWNENQHGHKTDFWKGAQKSVHPYSILPYEENQVCCLPISSEPSCWLRFIKLLYGNRLPWVSPKTKPMFLLKCPRCLWRVCLFSNTHSHTTALDDTASWLGVFTGKRRFDKLVLGDRTPPANPAVPGQTPSGPGPARPSSPRRLRDHRPLCFCAARTPEGGASVPNCLLPSEDDDAFDILGSFCFSWENFSLSSSSPSLSPCPSPSSPPTAPVLRTVVMHRCVLNNSQHRIALHGPWRERVRACHSSAPNPERLLLPAEDGVVCDVAERTFLPRDSCDFGSFCRCCLSGGSSPSPRSETQAGWGPLTSRHIAAPPWPLSRAVGMYQLWRLLSVSLN